MMSNFSPEYLSRDAYQRFQEELAYLTKEKRYEISQRLEEARSLGDLSENAEYQQAKEEQLETESRIAELEDIFSRAVIINSPGQSFIKVELGCVVVLKKDNTGEIVKYQIVGSEESNSLQNKISNESPVGALLLDKKKGEIIEIFTPKGKIKYTIIEIS